MSEVQIAIIDEQDTQITLAVPGVQGPSGAISSGGSANQVFYKVSNTNYDAGWTFIGNANVDAAAAIAGTKISPNFGSQATVTTGTNTAASFIPTSATIPSNGIYLPGANQVGVATNGTEKLIVLSNGNVGIGTSVPTSTLHIQHAAQTTGYWEGKGLLIHEDATANQGIAFYSRGSNEQYIASLADDAASYLVIGTRKSSSVNNVDALTIRGDGKVGIGTTGPNSVLQVNSGTNLGGILIGFSAGSSNFYDADLQVFRTGNGTERARIRTDGMFEVKGAGTAGSSPAFSVNGSAPANSAIIDTSGRLLVGTSTARSNFFNTASSAPQQLQVEGTTGNTCSLSSICCVADTSGGRLLLAHQRSGAVGGNTILNSGDETGVITFQGNDGGQFVESASIAAQIDGTPGADDMPGRLVFSTNPGSPATSPTERMRINNLGAFKATTTGNHAFATNKMHELRSDNNDRSVWISNTNASPYGIYIKFEGYDPNGTGNEFLVCDANATARATIRSNGGLANFSANNANLSDRNVKKDIALAAGTWDCIKEWEIVNYRYKDQPDNADLNLGVIAQQVAESCPEVITIFQEAKDATEDKPAQEERLGVKEQQMYWMAIKALQEAMGRIETLEQRLTAAGID